MLPLTFNDTSDYDKVKENDRIDLDVKNIEPGKQIKMTIKHSDGTNDTVILNHSLNKHQIEWFKVGSALNLMAKKSN